MSQDTAGANALSMVHYNEPTILPEQTDKDKMAVEAEVGSTQASDTMPDASRDMEDLLNVILPPRTWKADGKTWQQTVSAKEATREDVVRLRDVLQTRLAKTQARGAGLCAVRHGIYAECFDEIIRQVTINCTERGLLLLRIRDEMRMTLDACEILYGNAVEFGMRKAIQAGKEKEALTERVQDLKVSYVVIEKGIKDLKHQYEATERRTAEMYESEENKFEEQLVFTKKSNHQLKAQLEAIVAPRK